MGTWQTIKFAEFFGGPARSRSRFYWVTYCKAKRQRGTCCRPHHFAHASPYFISCPHLTSPFCTFSPSMLNRSRASTAMKGRTEVVGGRGTRDRKLGAQLCSLTLRVGKYRSTRSTRLRESGYVGVRAQARVSRVPAPLPAAVRSAAGPWLAVPGSSRAGRTR